MIAPDGFEAVSEDELEIRGLKKEEFFDAKTGLDARLYRNLETGEYTLAFQGTEDTIDWKANGLEMVGASRQHPQAVKLARRVSLGVRRFKRWRFVVRRPFIGGGLAETAAWAVRTSAHREAAVFNSAGASFLTSARSAQKVFDPNTSVTNYVVHGDPLTIGRQLDGVQKNVVTIYTSPGEGRGLLYRHSTKAVQSALRNIFGKYIELVFRRMIRFLGVLVLAAVVTSCGQKSMKTRYYIPLGADVSASVVRAEFLDIETFLTEHGLVCGAFKNNRIQRCKEKSLKNEYSQIMARFDQDQIIITVHTLRIVMFYQTTNKVHENTKGLITTFLKDRPGVHVDHFVGDTLIKSDE